MSIRIYVPRDAAAMAVGAEKLVAAIAKEAAARKIEIEIIRNGSRGMHWLEPLVEVVTPQGRVGYGPVAARDMPGLFDAKFHEGAAAQRFIKASSNKSPSSPSRRASLSRAAASSIRARLTIIARMAAIRS